MPDNDNRARNQQIRPKLAAERWQRERLNWLKVNRRVDAVILVTHVSGTRWIVKFDATAAYFAAEQKDGKNVAAFNARRSLPSPGFKGKVFSKADRFHVDYHLYTQALSNLSDWLAS